MLIITINLKVIALSWIQIPLLLAHKHKKRAARTTHKRLFTFTLTGPLTLTFTDLQAYKFKRTIPYPHPLKNHYTLTTTEPSTFIINFTPLLALNLICIPFPLKLTKRAHKRANPQRLSQRARTHTRHIDKHYDDADNLYYAVIIFALPQYGFSFSIE